MIFCSKEFTFDKLSNYCTNSYSNIKFVWHKVAAHTGDKYNEMADVLAKNGANLTEPIVKDYCSTKKNESGNQFCLFNDDSEKYPLFKEILLNNNYTANGIVMQNFYRFEIYKNTSSKIGIVDIYEKKDGLKLDLRAFKNLEDKENISNLWLLYLNKPKM